MTAGKMRGLTVNLSANSPILFVLENGTILDIIEQLVVPETIPDGDGCRRVGPDTLFLCLRARPKAEETNGTPAVPHKPIKIPRTGSGW